MEKQPKIASSLYKKIAVDIAANIAVGKYAEGQKLFGRSILASQYQVSPETIRKAVHILKDVGILDTEKGSGVMVLSVSKATEFIERHKEAKTITDVKNEISAWAQQQATETAAVLNKVQLIIDAAERFTATPPLVPFEITITGDAAVIGKTVSELCFWHHTGGTIVAIKRKEQLILSPGPYATFQPDDVFYIVGSEQAFAAANQLLSEVSPNNC